MRRTWAGLAVAAVAVLGLTGCGGGDGDKAAATACDVEGGTATTATGAVTVGLKEWTITPQPATFAAGPVKVTARNDGTEKHEVVIARAPINDLKVVDGAVDEDALPAGAFIGEIEAFDAGGTCEGVFELSPGTYSLFCNVVETEADGTRESHFEQGMVSAVTVGQG